MSSFPLNPVPGIPTSIAVSPATLTLALGATAQLTSNLLDAYGNTVTPTQAFTYSSSNPALVSVNSDGLCTAAASDPSELQSGGQVTVTISYPWAGTPDSGATISAVAVITVTVPPAESTTWFQTNDYAGPGTGGAGCWSPLPKLYPSA